MPGAAATSRLTSITSKLADRGRQYRGSFQRLVSRLASGAAAPGRFWSAALVGAQHRQAAWAARLAMASPVRPWPCCGNPLLRLPDDGGCLEAAFGDVAAYDIRCLTDLRSAYAALSGCNYSDYTSERRNLIFGVAAARRLPTQLFQPSCSCSDCGSTSPPAGLHQGQRLLRRWLPPTPPPPLAAPLAAPPAATPDAAPTAAAACTAPATSVAAALACVVLQRVIKGSFQERFTTLLTEDVAAAEAAGDLGARLDLGLHTLRDKVPIILSEVHAALSTPNSAEMIRRGWDKCGFADSFSGISFNTASDLHNNGRLFLDGTGEVSAFVPNQRRKRKAAAGVAGTGAPANEVDEFEDYEEDEEPGLWNIDGESDGEGEQPPADGLEESVARRLAKVVVSSGRQRRPTAVFDA